MAIVSPNNDELYPEEQAGLSPKEWLRVAAKQALDAADHATAATIRAADRVIPPLAIAIAFGALLVYSAVTDAVANARLQFLRP